MDKSHPIGSIVWVKLEGRRWWPGEVVSESDCPEIMKTLRKQPVAVVKFFDEDCFHIVKSSQNIHPYQCQKKEEFLKRGKDLKLSGKDSFSLRLKFDADVSKAESVCKEKQQNSSERTGEKPHKLYTRCSYMKMASAERFDYNISVGERENSHKVFLNENSDLGMPRIRKQPSTPKSENTVYTCDTCSFNTTRIDNIIRHHKTHSDPYRFHPAKETEHRFVFEKLSNVKSHKKSKVLSKSNSNKKNVSRKKLFSRSFSRAISLIRTSKKRERNDSHHKDNSTPKRKKAKLKPTPTKIPFTNPFEEEEQEEERKLQEMKALEEKKKNEEFLKHSPTNESLDVPSDGDEKESFEDTKKPSETVTVAWEEFIKDSPLKSRTIENTQDVNSSAKEHINTVENTSTENTIMECEKMEGEDALLKENHPDSSDEEEMKDKSSGVSLDIIEDINMLNEVKNESREKELEISAIKTVDTNDKEDIVLDNHYFVDESIKTDSGDWNKNDTSENKLSNEGTNLSDNTISDEIPKESKNNDELSDVENGDFSMVNNEGQSVDNQQPMIKDEFPPSKNGELSDVTNIEPSSVDEVRSSSLEVADVQSSYINEEPSIVFDEDMSPMDEAETSSVVNVESSVLDNINTSPADVSRTLKNGNPIVIDESKSSVIEKEDTLMIKNEELSIMETVESSILPNMKADDSKGIIETPDVEFEKISDVQIVNIDETVPPNHCVLQELQNELVVEQSEQQHIHHITMADDMPSEEIVMADNDMSTGEIIVGDTTLHPSEIVVGDEIEVQEIEIHSVVDDGIHTNEIVIGDDIVMQPMEIQLVPDASKDITQLQISHHAVTEESVASYEHGAVNDAEKEQISAGLILQPVENQGSELNVRFSVEESITIRTESEKQNAGAKEISASTSNDHESMVASETIIGSKPMYMTDESSDEMPSEDKTVLNSHGKRGVCNERQECSANSATNLGSRDIHGLDDYSDEELPPAFEDIDIDHKIRHFDEEDIVLAKYGKYFWPAVICKVYKKKKKMAIKFVDTPHQRNIIIPFRRAMHYTSEEYHKLRMNLNEESDLDLRIKSAIASVDEYLRKKVLRGNMPSPIQYFQCPFLYHSDNEAHLVGGIDKSIINEAVNQTQVATNCSSDGENEISDVSQKNICSHSTQQTHVELFSRIKSEACKEYLVKILRNEISSSRHNAFFNCSMSERNKLKHKAGFGALENYSQVEDLCNYLMELLLKEIADFSSFDKFSYIFNVWVPEALIWALRDLHNINYDKAERMFLRGNASSISLACLE